jgi:hypothetical protein
MPNRKLRSDSASVAVGSFAGAYGLTPVPDGVELRTQEERTIWEQFTRVRAREDWRDFDLIMVSKAVQIEADLRKYRAMLEETGAITPNAKGSLVANPLLTVIDQLLRQQLAVFRSLGLNQQPRDARTLNAGGKQAAQSRSAIDDADDLLARPIP